jgi:hypothetical protein
MGQEHGRTTRRQAVIAPFHYSLAGVALLLSVSVLSFALGVCVGVALMLVS